jgi:hypothetical protein
MGILRRGRAVVALASSLAYWALMLIFKGFFVLFLFSLEKFLWTPMLSC